MTLLLVTVPIGEKKDTKIKEESDRLIGMCEQFFTSITQPFDKGRWMNMAFAGSSAVAFEMALHVVGEDVHFYVSVPKKYIDAIEKQITAAIAGARVETVEDYNIFNPAGVARGAYLKLSRSAILPIRTYKHLENDPLNALTNAMSGLQFDGEGASIQILIKPDRSWQKTSQKVISEMRKGKNFQQAYNEATKGVLGTVMDIASSTNKKKTDEEEKKEQQVIDEASIKAIEEKASRPGFAVNIRLLASAYTETRANSILGDLENAFLQFENSWVNSFKSFRVLNRKLKKLIYDFSFRNFDSSLKMILNSEELASVFHFPTPYIENKKIKTLKSKSAPAPSELPQDGLVMGVNSYRGKDVLVRIPEEDRFRHIYIIGQTGTGKSVSIKNMIKQDIENGHGACYIDPHGEDLEEIMSRIPKERINDVVLFDPSDFQRPIGINMLEYDRNNPEQKSFIINEIISIFDKLYDLKATGGPMFEHYLRNALLLIMADPDSGSTLMEVPRVFSDKDFRHMKLEKVDDPLVKNFWIKEAEKAGGEASLQNITPYITSKFNIFLANEFVRPIISQQKSTINFQKIMDEKKILLANLSKGKIGDINSNLLGLLIVGKLTMAALARGAISKEERSPFYLYIDEFQNFAIDSISVILSEARKYKLSLTMAHQFIGQLPDNIRDAVFGNVGTIMSFRVGVDDAEFLEKQFGPTFDRNDLMNIENLNAYLRPLIRNRPVTPFNIKVDFPAKGNPDVVLRIKETSRLKYGRPKEEIEAEIEKRFAFDKKPEEKAPTDIKMPKEKDLS